MTQINRQLSLWQGPNDVQLRLTDPYGHINSVVSLTMTECQQLGKALVALQPIEVIDVEAVVVEDEESEPEVEAEAVDTDWAAMTRAEIVAEVEKRFDVHLDRDASKSTLIAAASDLEDGTL
jgi:hypothetical protein